MWPDDAYEPDPVKRTTWDWIKWYLALHGPGERVIIVLAAPVIASVAAVMWPVALCLVALLGIIKVWQWDQRRMRRQRSPIPDELIVPEELIAAHAIAAGDPPAQTLAESRNSISTGQPTSFDATLYCERCGATYRESVLAGQRLGALSHCPRCRV